MVWWVVYLLHLIYFILEVRGSALTDYQLSISSLPQVQRHPISDASDETLSPFHHLVSQYDTPHIVLIPPSLEFGGSQLLSPVTKHLDILNPAIHDALSVDILSIRSLSNEFSVPSTFEATNLPPLARIRIPIFYFPQKEGLSSSKLEVITSAGVVRISCIGTGLENKYKLHHFSGIVLPLDASTQIPIHLYNPHSSTLYVEDIFSTEQHVQISNINDEDLQITSFASSDIQMMKLDTSNVGGHSARLHLQTNQDNFIIPVDYTVVERAFNVIPDTVDFGTLTHLEERRYRSLSFVNLGLESIVITSSRLQKPDSNLQVQMFGDTSTLIIPPRQRLNDFIKLTYTGAQAIGDFSQSAVADGAKNFVLISTNHSTYQTIKIPLLMNVVHGSLAYSPASTMFSMWQQANLSNSLQRQIATDLITREIWVTNRFDIPVTIQSISVQNPAFRIEEASIGSVVYDHENRFICKLKYLPDESQPIFVSRLDIVTNVSHFVIPLYGYSEHLSVNLWDHSKPTVRTKPKSTTLTSLLQCESCSSPHSILDWLQKIPTSSDANGLATTGIDLLDLEEDVLVDAYSWDAHTRSEENIDDENTMHVERSSPFDFDKVLFPSLFLNSGAGDDAVAEVGFEAYAHADELIFDVPSHASYHGINTSMRGGVVSIPNDDTDTLSAENGLAIYTFTSECNLLHPMSSSSTLTPGTQSSNFADLFSLCDSLSHTEDNSNELVHVVDLGSITASQSHTYYLSITNFNPHPIVLTGAQSSHPDVSVSLQSIKTALKTQETHSSSRGKTKSKRKKKSKRRRKKNRRKSTASSSNMNEVFTVYHGQSVILCVKVVTSTAQSPHVATISLITASDPQTTQIKVTYSVVTGSIVLSPATVFIPDLFPGRTGRETIYLTNHYSLPVKVHGMITSDPRLIPVFPSRGVELLPFQRTEVGYFILDPSRCPISENYMLDLQLDPDETIKSADSSFVPPMSASIDANDPSANANAVSHELMGALSLEDVEAVANSLVIWAELEQTGATELDAYVTIMTGIKPPIDPVHVTASLVKPKLLLYDTTNFSTIKVNTSKSVYCHVHNPSDEPIFIIPIPPVNTSAFSLVAPPLLSNTNSTTTGDHGTMILQPRSDGVVGPIVFSPQDIGEYSAVLVIKNNLTRVSTVHLSGIGGEGKLVLKMGRTAAEAAKAFAEDNSSDKIRQRARKLPKSAASLRELSAVQVNITAFWSWYSSKLDNLSSSSLAEFSGSIPSSPFTFFNSGNLALTLLSASIFDPSTGSSVDACPSPGASSEDHVNSEDHVLSLRGCEALPMIFQPGESKAFRVLFRPDFISIPSGMILRIVTDTGLGATQNVPIEFTISRELRPHLVHRYASTWMNWSWTLSVISLLAILGAGIVIYQRQPHVDSEDSTAQSDTTSTSFKPVIAKLDSTDGTKSVSEQSKDELMASPATKNSIRLSNNKKKNNTDCHSNTDELDGRSVSPTSSILVTSSNYSSRPNSRKSKNVRFNIPNSDTRPSSSDLPSKAARSSHIVEPAEDEELDTKQRQKSERLKKARAKSAKLLKALRVQSKNSASKINKSQNSTSPTKAQLDQVRTAEALARMEIEPPKFATDLDESDYDHSSNLQNANSSSTSARADDSGSKATELKTYKPKSKFNRFKSGKSNKKHSKASNDSNDVTLTSDPLKFQIANTRTLGSHSIKPVDAVRDDATSTTHPKTAKNGNATQSKRRDGGTEKQSAKSKSSKKVATQQSVQNPKPMSIAPSEKNTDEEILELSHTGTKSSRNAPDLPLFFSADLTNNGIHLVTKSKHDSSAVVDPRDKSNQSLFSAAESRNNPDSLPYEFSTSINLGTNSPQSQTRRPFSSSTSRDPSPILKKPKLRGPIKSNRVPDNIAASMFQDLRHTNTLFGAQRNPSMSSSHQFNHIDSSSHSYQPSPAQSSPEQSPNPSPGSTPFANAPNVGRIVSPLKLPGTSSYQYQVPRGDGTIVDGVGFGVPPSSSSMQPNHFLQQPEYGGLYNSSRRRSLDSLPNSNSGLPQYPTNSYLVAPGSSSFLSNHNAAPGSLMHQKQDNIALIVPQNNGFTNGQSLFNSSSTAFPAHIPDMPRSRQGSGSSLQNPSAPPNITNQSHSDDVIWDGASAFSSFRPFAAFHKPGVSALSNPSPQQARYTNQSLSSAAAAAYLNPPLSAGSTSSGSGPELRGSTYWDE